MKVLRYRCAHADCRMRRTFMKHPKDMTRVPRCQCGRKDWTRDAYRQSGKERRKFTCYCGARHFPHRRGTCMPRDLREMQKNP